MPSTLLLIALGLVTLAVLVRLLEPRLAFFPLRGVQATPADLALVFEEQSVATSDGETLTAWYLPAEDADVEIVFWHGNGGNLSLWLDALAAIRRQGFSVLSFDYRGYGTSTGAPSEEALYRDTDAIVRHFAERIHQDGHTVIFWGRSLGGTFAAYATPRLSPDGLVLESSFPSARSLFSRNPVMGPLSLFSTYRFPTLDMARGFEGPALVLHGDSDRVIPFRHGRALFSRLTTPHKRFVTIAGGDHNDLWPASDTTYWAPIRRFIEECRGGGDGGRPESD